MSDIKLPPMHFMLKAYCKDTQNVIKSFARAAVELDRQGRGEPFMYGIMGPDRKPHWGELCVSGDKGDLQAEVFDLNVGVEDGPYREVALYLSPQPAEPVKAPSDDLSSIVERIIYLASNAMPENTPKALRMIVGECFKAQDALASYGQTAQANCTRCDGSGEQRRFVGEGAQGIEELGDCPDCDGSGKAQHAARAEPMTITYNPVYGTVREGQHPSKGLVYVRAAPVAAQPSVPTHHGVYRHIRSGGLYEVRAHAELETDQTPMVVYYSRDTIRTWVRPLSEFRERFEYVAGSLQAAPAPPDGQAKQVANRVPVLSDLRALVSNDAYACTFQSMGQYRTAIIRAVDAAVQQEAQP